MQPVEPLCFPQMPQGNTPRCSSRIRVPATRPDNFYGNRPPVDILQDNDDNFFGGPQRNQSPGPSGSGTCPTNNPLSAVDLAKIAQDGGAKLINLLLSAAVSSADAKEEIPNVSKVHEWHFRDLMHFPKAVQKEWKTACKEELKALHQGNVFKLTNLPKGHKTIGCRWVFNVKSDGCGKASL